MQTIILTVSTQCNFGKIFIEQLGKVTQYMFEFNEEFSNGASNNIVLVSLSEASLGLPQR